MKVLTVLVPTYNVEKYLKDVLIRYCYRKFWKR